MKQEIASIRQWLQSHLLGGGTEGAYIIPSTDPHCGEYIPDNWKLRQWASGFDGSAGTLVVTTQEAALWTDSRYFLQAAQQLQGTGIQLMKDGLEETPSIPQWLQQKGATLCFDGWVNTVDDVRSWKAAGLNPTPLAFPFLAQVEALAGGESLSPVEVQPLEFAGEESRSKLSRLRQKLTEHGAEGIIVSLLDEVAWLTNLRGTDVHCNPVFVSYLLVTKDDATLFLDPVKLDAHVQQYLQQQGIGVRPYGDVLTALQQYSLGSIALDTATTNWNLFSHLPQGCRIVELPSLIAPMKAIKNESEIQGFRNAMLRDGVAMVRFLRWLKPAVEEGAQTEMSIDAKLTALRAQQPLYRGLSFDTIAAYGSHGAIVHYEATPQTDIPLQPQGLLLLDSGAQYQDGTTDITRTIPLGPLTESERMDYTLVLKGHIRLALTKFPKAACGTQIDALARYAMWQHGINFLHGTGHGVGSYLNVHEGPHQIRMNYKPAPLLPGMTVTNEPGIYRAGEHGVRIENTMLVTPYMKTAFGEFLQLEALTLCPIATSPIIMDMMQQDELDYLNSYHQRVYEELAPLLQEEERIWLWEQTRPISTT